MRSRLGVTLSALGLITGGLALGTPAQADVRVGVMTCEVNSALLCRQLVLLNIMRARLLNSALISDTCKMQ